MEFDLEEMMIRMKEDRKRELLEEIKEIERTRFLLPGHAGKLKGKLMFGASQLYGKLGRAALRSLSERQREIKGNHDLNPAIEASLEIWKRLIKSGRPRTLLADQSQFADAFFFTDVSTGKETIVRSDGAREQQEVHRIGGVLFAWWMESPKAFGIEGPAELFRHRRPRRMQIK